jgi:GT2 family glycosyltransferase
MAVPSWPMSHELRVDVVLVNYRGWAQVVEAVRQLRGDGQGGDGAHHEGWPWGVIRVVDNSEDPSEARALNAALGTMPDVRVQVMERNLGFGAGCNAAWSGSKADHVLLLNPDARISREGVRQLAVSLQAHPELGAVSPRTWWDRPGGWVLPCPTPQDAGARLRRGAASRRDPSGWADAQVSATRQTMGGAQPVQVTMLAGAVLMVRRSAVEAAATSQGLRGCLFDPAFFMYFEDADLSRRLRAAGWRLALLPTVDALHEWRHQPHKAPMMARGEAIFLQRQPWLYRALRRIWPDAEAMGCLQTPAVELSDAHQAARVLGQVEALSPAPSGDPAWVRWLGASPLTADEWTRLEPGRYWARTAQGWQSFDKRG